MSDIFTITFSPCIDKSFSVPAFIPEKKLKCSQPKLEPGGGGINVARAIKKLGGNATAIFPAGGYTGKFLIKLMTDEAVPLIITHTENETRENIIVLEESTNRQYRFGMPGTILYEPEWKEMLTAIEKINNPTFIVASGSLPSGMPHDIFAQIAFIAKRKNLKLVVDTSGEPLKYAVNEGVYLLKPNLGELSSLVNKDRLEGDEIAEAARQIIGKGKCEVVIVSMADAGAMLVTENINRVIRPPQVEKKSTVGAGDSMVAGVILKLSKGKGLEEAFQYGVACGTAATMSPGTELCTKENADKLFADIR